MTQIDSMKEDEGFRLLSVYLKSLEGRDLEKVRLELAVEYAALFLGMRAGLYHPSESAYTTSTHFIMQEPRSVIVSIYRNAGVDKVSDFSEPEDHIAMELQFMAHLCGRTVEALQGGNKSEASKLLLAQLDFIDKHLLVWVPKFTEDVIKASEIDLYKAVAKITGSFIELDKNAIGELNQEIGRL